jgi:biopolymer transport protein ExbD
MGNNRGNLKGLFSRRKPVIGLRMAPMIDIIFLLLIFFLVAAKWRPKEDFLPLQLATAGLGSAPAAKPEPLIIQIAQRDADCRVQIGSSQTVEILSQNPEAGLAEMMTKTRQCLLDQKRYATDPVEIICAPDVKWENLARIYNVLVGMGLSDITFRMTRLGEGAAKTEEETETPSRSRTEVPSGAAVE